MFITNSEELNGIDSITVPSDEQSDFNRYDNIVSDLDNLIGGAIGNINNRNYTHIYATPRPVPISNATKGPSTVPSIPSSGESISVLTTRTKDARRTTKQRKPSKTGKQRRKTSKKKKQSVASI